MTVEIKLTRLQDSLGFQVTRLARAMEQEFEHCLGELKMSRTMWCVMACVALDEKTKPSEISETIGVDRAVVTRQIAEALKRGWLLTQQDACDGRSKKVCLTRSGKRAFQTAKAYSEAVNTKFLGNIDPLQQAQFSELIGLMLKQANLLTAPL